MNAKQRVLAVRKIVKVLDGEVMNKKVAVLGLAFKPGTDDVREAPALDIIKCLCSEGAKVSACDPMAIENAKNILKEVDFYSDPYRACAGCEAIILTTEWPEFLDLDWKKIRDQMQPPYAFIDGRNALDKNAARNFKYRAFGRRVD